MRAVVVVALHGHELHVEVAVVVVLGLARAEQALVTGPDEEFTKRALVLGPGITLGDRQQVIVEAVELRLAAGLERGLDEANGAVEIARLRRRTAGFGRCTGCQGQQRCDHADDPERRKYYDKKADKIKKYMNKNGFDSATQLIVILK